MNVLAQLVSLGAVIGVVAISLVAAQRGALQRQPVRVRATRTRRR